MTIGPITAADYKGEVVAGKRWTRAYRVTIMNPYLGDPVIAFDEEVLIAIEDSVKSAPTATLSASVDMSATIDLIDPSTGLALGAAMSHQQVYVALYSLYRQLGAARDAAEVAAAKAAADRAAQLAGTP